MSMVIVCHTLIALVLNIFQKKSKQILGNKNIKTNIFRKDDYDSIICGNFCIGFIEFMFKGKGLTDFTNLFLPNNLKKK